MSVFNEGQIRQAIESLQKIHPVNGFYNITHLNDMESISIIQKTINEVCKQAEKDTEIYLICEMAKQYLNGARPTFDRPQGKWIPVSERLPEFSGLYLISIDSLVTVANFSGTHFINCGGVRVDVGAWQPLPKPYKEGGRQ